MKLRRGITLVEVLAAMALAGVIMAAVTTAFRVATDFSVRAPQARDEFLNQLEFERKVRDYLENAYVDNDAANESAFFVANSEGTEGGLSLDSGTAATSITFTRIYSRPPGASLETDDSSFEERNTARGPVGGLVETQLSLTPVGDAGSLNGLFLREQRPSDNLETEGGTERLLDSRVSEIGFEFFDGENWIGQWDTITGARRIPAAIRVSYRLTDDQQDVVHRFVVKPLFSDVTTANPETGATQ
ncbi:MAG: prepilin-type N-terminal cleavage/methylation domain-containing protein [Armatimonadetes bacterium]|nr:prepilin-type N-terminal cleavage/methylation domain-containing protein [Armatimonadota bacterium]